jgi:hypothetical protein
MHAFGSEDIDRPGKRCRGRGHKDSEPPVFEFFNNECGNEGLFNFDQRRLPYLFLTTSRELLGQTAKECVTWDSLEEGFLNSLPRCPTCWPPNSNAYEETDKQHEEKREQLFGGERFREQLSKWPHNTPYRLHGSE